MTGIQHITDEKGRKVAVQIDLKKHRELLRQDVAVSKTTSSVGCRNSSTGGTK
jgi:hypothetical protein